MKKIIVPKISLIFVSCASALLLGACDFETEEPVDAATIETAELTPKIHVVYDNEAQLLKVEADIFGPEDSFITLKDTELLMASIGDDFAFQINSAVKLETRNPVKTLHRLYYTGEQETIVEPEETVYVDFVRHSPVAPELFRSSAVMPEAFILTSPQIMSKQGPYEFSWNSSGEDDVLIDFDIRCLITDEAVSNNTRFVRKIYLVENNGSRTIDDRDLDFACSGYDESSYTVTIGTYTEGSVANEFTDEALMRSINGYVLVLED